jgi:hypothetical protein
MMKVCVIYEMKFGPNLFTKAKGIFLQRFWPLFQHGVVMHNYVVSFVKALLVRKPLRKLPT